MARKPKKSKSPYCKYGKKPYRYSDLLMRWTAAAKAGRTAEKDALGRQHSQWVLGTQWLSDEAA